MVDEKRWGWSGLKGLDEIYNFCSEAESKKQSLEAQKFELIFWEKGFQDFKERNLDLRRWGLYIEG
jgi:hypothetical protein